MVNTVIKLPTQLRGRAVTFTSAWIVGLNAGRNAGRNARAVSCCKPPIHGLHGIGREALMTKRLSFEPAPGLVLCGRGPTAVCDDCSIHDKSVWRHSTGEAVTTKHATGVESDCRTGPPEGVAQCGWDGPGPEPA